MIAIIKYNAGNNRSVQNVLTKLGCENIVTSDPQIIASADKVIFPGVGEASSAMNYLRAQQLDQLIISLKQPLLGICLGMQLLCSYSEEGSAQCLNIFPTRVKKFPKLDKIPHMGWNNMNELKSELFSGLNHHDDLYFVHSYYVEHCKNTIAMCNYILPFSAAIKKDNFYATQFHPEKSGEKGEQVLRNFLSLK